MKKVATLNYSYIYLAFPINTATLSPILSTYHFSSGSLFTYPVYGHGKYNRPRLDIFIPYGCFQRFRSGALKGETDAWMLWKFP